MLSTAYLTRSSTSYGIKGKAIKWIEDVLTKRTQEVVVEEQNSYKRAVTLGVPRGTVLGQILFHQ